MKIARLRIQQSIVWAIVFPQKGTFRIIDAPFNVWAETLTNGGTESDLSLRDEQAIKDAVYLPPIEGHSQVFVAGANYLSHMASDFKIAPPTNPTVFLKSTRALTGAYDDIPYPPITEKLDYEIELIAVVGKKMNAQSKPIKCVLGYTIGNDISARDLQKGSPSIGMDLFSAKSLDRSSPVGPWIVTRDEFGDSPPDLAMSLCVNGEVRQRDRTSAMRWDIPALLQFINKRVALEPGDLLFTGTPAGVGHADGNYLRPGNRVEAMIECLGRQRNLIV